MKKISIGLLSLIATVGWSTALILSSKTDNSSQSLAQILPAVHHVKPVVTAWDTRGVDFAQKDRTLPLVLSSKPATPKVLGASTYNTDQLSPQQALDLDKPGVISIINRLEGSVEIPDFDIDLKTFALSSRPDLAAHDTTIDEDLYGSGFIISSDGHAITNAHVISKLDIYVQLRKDVAQHVQDVYKYEVDNLSDKGYKAYNQTLDKLYGAESPESDKKIQDAMDAAIDSYIVANAKDNTTQKIVAVDKSISPDSLPQGDELETIFSKGLPVTIVGFDPDYKVSGADVALIQIPGTNLPALPLGDTTGETSGSSVVVLGYPYNAQINSADVFQPTLTQGIISSVKQLNNQTVFQLDNKTSEGSSGSPVTDSHGRVIGIITYINGDPSTGDQFTYALPIDLAKNLMSQYQVTNDLGTYGTNFLLGISLENQNSCKKAIDAFNAAGQADSHFAPETYVSHYIDSCQSLITAGQSKDTTWDVIRIFYTDHTANAAVFSSLGLALLILIVWMLIYLLKPKHSMSLPSQQVNV